MWPRCSPTLVWWPWCLSSLSNTRRRRQAGGLHKSMELPFVEVFVDTLLEVCE